METGHISQQTKDKAKAGAAEAAGAVVDAGNNAAQKVGEVAANVGQKVQETAKNVGQKVQEVASRAVDKTDHAIAGVGERLASTADSIRNVAPHEGVLGTAAGTVADNLKAGGQYLQEHGVEDMMKDITRVISRNPLPSVFIALGAGFLLGAALRRR